jgi:integral membrane sensor domain MASE1
VGNILQNPTPEVHRRGSTSTTPPWIGPTGIAIAVSGAYFFAAQLGLALRAEPDGVAVFWPAAGVSSGVLIALGRDARLPVAASTMVATIASNLTGDRNVWTATAFAFCNAGEALFVAWLIERYYGSDFSLDGLRNVLGLLAAAVVATAASGVGGAAAVKLFHTPTAPIWTIWLHWFASDAVGIIIVAPLVIGLADAMRAPPNEIVEGVTALVALAATIVLVNLLPFEPWQAVRPAVLLFPVLLWLAARCQPVFGAAGAFIVSLTIVWTTTFGIGQLGNPTFPIGIGDPTVPIGSRILAAQLAIAACTLSANVLAALFAERRQAEERQSLLSAELDHRVKNVLARVAAVVRHSRRGSGIPDEFVNALDGRIQAIAAAHTLLSQSRWSVVGLADLIRRQLAPYTTDANTVICHAHFRADPGDRNGHS